MRGPRRHVAHLPLSSRLRMADGRDRLGLAYPTFFAEVETSTPTPERQRGILVGVGGVLGNVVRIQPPLSITADECDRAAGAIEEEFQQG